jgi:hypothetical protein
MSGLNQIPWLNKGPTASLKYNFGTYSWEAIADWDWSIVGAGRTPEQAVEALRHECDKHGLWPPR